MKYLFILNDPPYGTERSYNALRLADFNIRRSLLQKFIHRVEIGVDSIKIYWNLDKDFYEQELKIKNPEKNRGFIKTANFGSHSLTIGARRGT